MDTKYGTLKFVAGLKIFIGVVTIIIGIISLLIALLGNDDKTYTQAELIIITISSIVGGLILIAAGQLIYLFIDIERNTRNKNKSESVPNLYANVSHPDKNEFENELDFKVAIADLNKLIIKERKKIISGQNEEITNLLLSLVKDKDTFDSLERAYQVRFNKNIIKELSSISTSYETTFFYVEPFVRLGLCEKEFPHKKIE